MASITERTLTMDMEELRAIRVALGRMSADTYKNDRLAAAGSEVYNLLVPFTAEDEED